MSVAYESSSAEQIEELERNVLTYLEDKPSAPADEIIRAVQEGRPFLTPAPIVTAIWSLNAKNRIRINGDWIVTLRERDVKANAAG